MHNYKLTTIFKYYRTVCESLKAIWQRIQELIVYVWKTFTLKPVFVRLSKGFYALVVYYVN